MQLFTQKSEYNKASKWTSDCIRLSTSATNNCYMCMCQNCLQWCRSNCFDAAEWPTIDLHNKALGFRFMFVLSRKTAKTQSSLNSTKVRTPGTYSVEFFGIDPDPKSSECDDTWIFQPDRLETKWPCFRSDWYRAFCLKISPLSEDSSI